VGGGISRDGEAVGCHSPRYNILVANGRHSPVAIGYQAEAFAPTASDDVVANDASMPANPRRRPKKARGWCSRSASQHRGRGSMVRFASSSSNAIPCSFGGRYSGQFRHHSRIFPCMSNRPKSFGQAADRPRPLLGVEQIPGIFSRKGHASAKISSVAARQAHVLPFGGGRHSVTRAVEIVLRQRNLVIGCGHSLMQFSSAEIPSVH
jgi:hypothetical protein